MRTVNNGHNHHKTLSFEGFTLHPGLQKVEKGGINVHFAKRPLQVLIFLVENRDRVVGRDELLAKFWDGHEVYDEALRKCIGAIRKALGDRGDQPRFIEIRRGSGYRFIAEVSENEEVEPHSEKSTELRDFPFSGDLNGGFLSRYRFVLVSAAIFAVVSFTSAGYYAYRRQTTHSAAKNLTETVAAKRSIAILPIKNLTGDTANDYLSDGITEGLINEIARIDTLKVISRSSVFQFKNRDDSAEEIGRRLGVETVLEGGLRKSGEELRIEVRLVNTSDGSVIWASDSSQKKMADIFAVEDRITCQIVAELKVKLCGEVSPSGRYTQNVKAYQLYLQGLYYRNRLGKDDLKKAIEFFHQALEIDPGFALAHEGLASTYTVMELNSVVPAGSVAKLAEEHANKALETDENLSGAYLALGVVKTLNNYDLAERERYYKQALQRSSNNRTAHLWLSNLYTARGEFDRAEAEALRAQEIDPLSYGVRLTLADIYYYWRKPDKVIEQADLMLDAKADDMQAWNYKVLAEADKGEFEKAVADLDKTPPKDQVRVIVFAAAGRMEDARKAAAEFAATDDAKNVPFKLAGAYALLGDKEAAFAWLEKSYAMRQADLVSIKIDPSLKSLHGDPRFADLLRRVNLE